MLNFITKAFRRSQSSAVNQLPGSQPGGLFSWVREPYAGAWQQGVSGFGSSLTGLSDPLENPHLASAIEILSGDLSKMVPRLERLKNGVWQTAEISEPALEYPNANQTPAQLWREFFTSLLVHGNAYILLKYRGGDVAEMHCADPRKVKIRQYENGDLLYDFAADANIGLIKDQTVPASAVIHMMADGGGKIHKYVGCSPLMRAALSGALGNVAMQTANSTLTNIARPSGIISAPGNVSQENIKAIKEAFENNYSGGNVARTAILADGLTYSTIPNVSLVDQSLADSVEITAKIAATVFRLPAYKLNAGPVPSGLSAAQLEQQYINDTLSGYVIGLEQLLSRVFGNGLNARVRLDESALLRLDPVSMAANLRQLKEASILSPNECRAALGYAPVDGGEAPLSQQQYYSLAGLKEAQALALVNTPAANDSDIADNSAKGYGMPFYDVHNPADPWDKWRKTYKQKSKRGNKSARVVVVSAK